MSTLETLPHNGAGLAFDQALGKWCAFAADGSLAGYRRSEAAARALAASLPVPEMEPIVPLHRLAVSPKARERGVGAGMDVYVEVPEPDDGAPSKAMSPARARSGAGPSDRHPELQPRPRKET
jgi:hypothetical protein